MKDEKGITSNTFKKDVRINKLNNEAENTYKFKICHNKGFHITFKNGWTVSVQWGYGNYCDNYNDFDFTVNKPKLSNTAEVWSWFKDKKIYYPQEPLGYQTPEQVLKFINKVAKIK